MQVVADELKPLMGQNVVPAYFQTGNISTAPQQVRVF